MTRDLCIKCIKKYGNPHDLLERYVSFFGPCDDCRRVTDIYPCIITVKYVATE